jgi:hypothetical protein
VVWEIPRWKAVPKITIEVNSEGWASRNSSKENKDNSNTVNALLAPDVGIEMSSKENKDNSNIGSEKSIASIGIEMSSKENKDNSNIGSEKSIDNIGTEMSSHLVNSSAPSNPAALQQHTSQYLNEQPPLQHKSTAVRSRLSNSSSPAVYNEETPNINIEDDGIEIGDIAKAGIQKERTSTCLQPPTDSNTNRRELAHQKSGQRVYCTVPGCGIDFARSADMVRHQNEKHGETLHCPHCNYPGTKRPARLRKHIEKHFNNSTGRPWDSFSLV